MFIQEEDAQTLTRLGLTSSQAKVYLALVTLGKANGKTIWKYSGVARQDIYRVLTELQEKGLVEKTLTKPSEFKAIPIQEGLEILLNRKSREYGEIEEKTRKLVQKLKNSQEETRFHEEETRFYLIPAKEAALKMKKCVAAAKRSVDSVASWKRFQLLTSMQMEDLLNALNRGVKFRWVVSKPEDKEIMPKTIQDYMEKPSCEVRYAYPFSPEAAVTVYDKKEALIATEAKTPFYLDSAMLWSNNPSFAAVMQQYFDLMWEKALEMKP